MADSSPVDTPIVVFISSHQNEFQELRNELKDQIDGAELFDRYLMKVELVERRSGERIRGDITRAAKDAAIYVGIFGNKYSKTTMEEYRDARRRGIPLLVFEAPKKRKKRRHHLVNEFLEKQVKELDVVRITTLKRNHEVSGILERVANEVAAMVQQNLEVRRTLNPQ